MEVSVGDCMTCSKKRNIDIESYCFKDEFMEIFFHSSDRQFKTSVPHMLQKWGIDVTTFHLLFSEDVDIFT